MPALSFWDIAAKRPSCLMAVTPYRGGTWASMLKPGVAWPQPVTDPTLPTWAQQVGLLTYENIIVSEGVFKPADPSQVARIDTALDLRGKVSDYTVIVEFEAVEFSGSLQKQELAGQGACITAGYIAILALAYYRYNDNTYRLILSQEVNNSRKFVIAILPSALHGRHIAAGKITVGESSTVFSLYLDGVPIHEETFAGIPSGIANASYTDYTINDNRKGSWVNYFGKIYRSLVFNRALTAAEIAQFK